MHKLNLLDLNFQLVVEEHPTIQIGDFLSVIKTPYIMIILAHPIEVKDLQILLILCQ